MQERTPNPEPDAEDKPVTGVQSVGPTDVDIIAPEDRRGGTIRPESLPEALDYLAAARPRGSWSESILRLVAVYVNEAWKRTLSADEFQKETLKSIKEQSAELAQERVKRAVAEERLAAHERYQPTKVILVGFGVGLAGMGLEHLSEPQVGYALIGIGAVMIFVGLISGRSKP